MFILKIGGWQELYYLNHVLDRLSTDTNASSRVTPSVDSTGMLSLKNVVAITYSVDIIFLRKR